MNLKNPVKFKKIRLLESLRLHYVVAHFARTCVEPVEIEFPKGKRVKFDVGDTVYLPVYEIFRDPEYFEKPLEFNPDRFSEENGGVKAFMDRGTFFPFGNGPSKDFLIFSHFFKNFSIIFLNFLKLKNTLKIREI